LSHNQLESVDDVEPLNYLTSLRQVNLEHMFGRHVSADAKADLLRNIFKSNHSFVDLIDVNLGNNGLATLHADTFCSMKGLVRLTLSNNLLTSLVMREGCLQTLKALDLRNNRLSTIPSNTWISLPALNSIDTSSNPLSCDCSLEEFHRFALSEVNCFLNQEETVCASPEIMSGQKLFELQETMCPEEGGNWLWRFFLLVLVGALITVIYRKRQKVTTFLSECAKKSPIRVPVSVANGYSQLKESSGLFSGESAVQPEFV